MMETKKKKYEKKKKHCNQVNFKRISYIIFQQINDEKKRKIKDMRWGQHLLYMKYADEKNT